MNSNYIKHKMKLD